MLNRPAAILQAARVAETADRYPHITLNDEWRIILDPSAVQYILQQARNGSESTATTRWEGIAFCRTREALLRCSREYCGPIGPTVMAAIEALPVWAEPTMVVRR